MIYLYYIIPDIVLNNGNNWGGVHYSKIENLVSDFLLLDETDFSGIFPYLEELDLLGLLGPSILYIFDKLGIPFDMDPNNLVYSPNHDLYLSNVENFLKAQKYPFKKFQGGLRVMLTLSQFANFLDNLYTFSNHLNSKLN